MVKSFIGIHRFLNQQLHSSLPILKRDDLEIIFKECTRSYMYIAEKKPVHLECKFCFRISQKF